MRKELIVKCSPNHVPYSLPILLNLAEKNGVTVQCAVHIHSDITSHDEEYRERLMKFVTKSNTNDANADLRLIWTVAAGRDLNFNVNGRSIFGEINLLKYLMHKWQLNTVHISNLDEGRLDEVYQVIYGRNHEFAI